VAPEIELPTAVNKKQKKNVSWAEGIEGPPSTGKESVARVQDHVDNEEELGLLRDQLRQKIHQRVERSKLDKSVTEEKKGVQGEELAPPAWTWVAPEIELPTAVNKKQKKNVSWAEGIEGPPSTGKESVARVQDHVDNEEELGLLRDQLRQKIHQRVERSKLDKSVTEEKQGVQGGELLNQQEKEKKPLFLVLEEGDPPQGCLRYTTEADPPWDAPAEGKGVDTTPSSTGKPRPGKKAHVCETCGKAFSEANKLGRHMLIHTREKSHVCVTCGRAFARTDSLASHRLTHTKRVL